MATNRERLAEVSNALLKEQGAHVALVSDELAATLTDWSRPVQVKVVPTDTPGLLEIICRAAEAEPA